MRDAMDMHSGDEPGVVDFDADYRMHYHQPPPLRMGLFDIGQPHETRLNQLGAAIGLRNT